VVIDGGYRRLESASRASLRTILAPAPRRPDDFAALRDGPGPAPDACGSCGKHLRGLRPPGLGRAVRSSAAGEDGELSFAGQFDTVLNVAGPAVPEAWKKVVMSRFSPRAVFYRRAAGLAEVDTPMAVLVQRMVRARASGVLYTRRPDDPKAPALLVAAGRGLGPEVSEGTASADELVVSRASPHRVGARRIARKPVRIEAAREGGLARVEVAVEEQTEAAISDEDVARLAAAGLEIERYWRAPGHRVGLDGEDRLFVLQARPPGGEGGSTGAGRRAAARGL
jgi:pyruvate,water dikinase